MKRKASAVWKGGLKDGKGAISTDSGVLANTQYSFGTRFEEGKGTNPEELIAAAHAGCFSMALSGQLGNAGMTADEISTISDRHAGKDGCRLHGHLGPSGRHGKNPRRRREGVRNGRQQRQGRLPDFAIAQYENHDGREVGVNCAAVESAKSVRLSQSFRNTPSGSLPRTISLNLGNCG